MSVAEVLPLIMMLPDAIAPATAAGLLGLPKYVLPGLVELKLIKKLDGPIRGFMREREAYSRSSVEHLAHEIRRRSATPVPAGATRMSRAVRSLICTVTPWEAVISAVMHGDIDIYSYRPRRMNIRNNLAVTDVPAFAASVRKHMGKREADQVEWIAAATVSEILKVTEIFVYRLVKHRPDLLKNKKNGHAPFLLADVLKISQEYMFVPEICERGRAHARRMCRWLRGQGIKPPIALRQGKDFGFWRREVEKPLAELEALHVRRVAELKLAPDNERTRLIRAVEAGTPIHAAAKKAGIPYKKALICVDRWRDTGDWSVGKGGVRSLLEEHGDWLKEMMAKNPQLSLSGIHAALKAKHKVSTDDGTLIRWLDRKGIPLARRRRAPLKTATEASAAR